MKGNLLEKYAVPKAVETETPDEQVGIPDDLGAFGFLRGVHDRALMLEVRFKNGKKRGLGYAWLHDLEFDPSEGITLHFGGKQVKITGQNLNAEVRPNVRLFAAILRHRVSWIQEADGPTMMESSKSATIIERIELK